MHCPYCHLDYSFEEPCFCAPHVGVAEKIGPLHIEVPVHNTPVMIAPAVMQEFVVGLG